MYLRKKLSWNHPTRLLLLACLCLGLSLPAFAQRGGGGGGGMGGGGMGGGNMGGGMGSGGMGNNGGFGGGNTTRPDMPNYRSPYNSQPVIRTGPQLTPPGGGRWWDEKKAVKSLKLSSDQQKRMDNIFETNQAALGSLLQNLQREELRLGAMTPDDLRDESKVDAQIDRVYQARADLQKATAHVFIQVRKELDADQLAKLDKEIADASR